MRLGTKEYIDAGNTPPDWFFDDPSQFFIKYASHVTLDYIEGQGWLSQINFDKQEVHGWGDNFENGQFDSQKAYFGGEIWSSGIYLEPIVVNLPK